MADKKQVENTGINTHRATARGFGADQLVEPEQFVPPGVPVSEKWMEPVDKKTARMLQAADEATDKQPKDIDLTKLNVSALQALAAEHGINVDGLTKRELIDAIKAAAAQTA